MLQYPKLKEAYVKFMQEYENLGHMEPIDEVEEKTKYIEVTIYPIIVF
jgi:hypothetical protein